MASETTTDPKVPFVASPEKKISKVPRHIGEKSLPRKFPTEFGHKSQVEDLADWIQCAKPISLQLGKNNRKIRGSSKPLQCHGSFQRRWESKNHPYEQSEWITSGASGLRTK